LVIRIGQNRRLPVCDCRYSIEFVVPTSIECRGCFTTKCPKAALAMSVDLLAYAFRLSTSVFFSPAKSAFS
jgi:hypothetical protein